MRTILVLMLIGFIGLCAAHMHERPKHDSSEEDEDHECECRHHGPPPPKDDIPLPEAEGDMDDDMKMPEDFEDMSEEKKNELMEEFEKHEENKRCCRKHRHRKLVKIVKIIVGSVVGGVVVIAAVIAGCCCYHKRCKGSRTCPDQKYSTNVYNRFGLSAEHGYVKEPLPAGDIVTTGSLPPTYTTVPMYGGGPRELILTAPPAYATEEKKTALP